MRRMLEPFALEVYRRFLKGETIQEISLDLGIPADRIRQRVEAAAVYRKREREAHSSGGRGQILEPITAKH